jgi:hypothetical protein
MTGVNMVIALSDHHGLRKVVGLKAPMTSFSFLLIHTCTYVRYTHQMQQTASI